MILFLIGNNLICGDDQKEKSSREIAAKTKPEAGSQRHNTTRQGSASTIECSQIFDGHSDIGREIRANVIHSETRYSGHPHFHLHL